MKQGTGRDGFVLVLTMMILSIVIVVITQLANKSFTHVYFDKTMIAREKAKSLAFGGISLAISQLAPEPKKKKEAKDNASKSQDDEKMALAKRILPTLNRWQEFPLKKDIDGIDGTIQISIGCEEGKININELYDFEKKKFKGEGQSAGDMKKLAQTIFSGMKKFTHDKSIFEQFVKFLGAQERMLDDSSQLLSNNDFQKEFKTAVFYEPPKKSEKKRPVYLNDIFTIWSGTSKIQAWVLSDSVLAIANLKRAEANDVAKRKQTVMEIAKEFKMQASIESTWNKYLNQLYGKNFKDLDKNFQDIMDASFDPTIFSVVSYGIVDEITQKIFAIIEKQTKEKEVEFVVKKIYWL